MARGRPPTPTEHTRIAVENALLAGIVGLLLENDRTHTLTAPGALYENAALHWYTGHIHDRLVAQRDAYAALWHRVNSLLEREP